MHGIMQDFQFALRLIRKRPGASLVIVATLALGIGINATFFSAYYGMAVRPLPFHEPEQLVTLHRARPETGETYLAPSPADRYSFAESETLTDLEAFQHQSFNLNADGPPERISGAVTTAGLFSMLGVERAHGRLFSAADGRPGAARVAILSDDLWRRSFGSELSVLGSIVHIDGEATEVIGIMPPRFAFPLNQELWLPIQVDRATAPRSSGTQLLGRRAASSSVAAVEDAMNAKMAELEERFPKIYQDLGIKVRPLHEAWMPPVTQIAALAMQILASLVLLIVCANVANMVLAQATLRRQEQALRAALGASRSRLMRQSLVESLVLAAFGGAAGLLLTIWQGDWMNRLSAVPVPYWLSFDLNGPVLLFACGATLVAAIGIALAPSLRGMGANLVDQLKAGGRSDGAGAARDGWLRTGLVVAEYALAVIVLVGALLMLRAYDRLQNADTGFAVEDRVTLKLSLPIDGEDPRRRGLDNVERALNAVAALPEVHSATAISYLPIENGPSRQGRLEIPGQDVIEGGEQTVAVHAVADNFFTTLNIPVVAGRTFTALEHEEGRGSALLSAGLAARLWPGENPIGRKIRLASEDFPWLNVVGIARDIEPGEPLAGIDKRADDQIYVPLSLTEDTAQEGTWGMLSSSPALIIESSAALAALGPSLRQTLASSLADVPVYAVKSMEQVLRQHYFAQHIWSRLFALIAFVALGIAAIGAYGVSAYAVSRRLREIGIRLALGADPSGVMRAVVGRGLCQALLGLAIGLLVSLPMANAMAGLLHGVSLWDPEVMGGVLFLLATVAALATLFPARRAARVDPVVALREG